MSRPHGAFGHEAPAVDERLVAPGSRYEVMDGEVIYVPPADEPHGSAHAKVVALVAGHVVTDYLVACDMLTRTSERDDIAPDVSVYPSARDPETGGRRLEELAFEIMSTERLSHAGRKARKLTARGVRRVFAVDVDRGRVFEWSQDLDTWSILPDAGAIEDRLLVRPLPIAALVRDATADDNLARALIAKRNTVVGEAVAQGRAEGRIEGRAEGRTEAQIETLLAILESRGLVPSPAELATLRAPEHAADLGRWLVRAASKAGVADVAELLRG